MPLFAWIGRDGRLGAELRPLHRPAHLARAGRVVHAGPLLDASGQPCGSLIVFEADDLAAAHALAATDPYATAGVFASFEVLETRRVLP